MTEQRTKTAALYTRVSDRKQARDDVSLPAQEDAGRRKAAELGASVVRVFVDAGRSGFKEGNRPTFEDAVDFCVCMEIDYLIVWSSARFARNRFEAMTFKRELAAGGVKLIYTSSDIDIDTDEGWLTDSMMEVIDEMRSRNTSKDTVRSMLRNARSGYFCGGVPPYGFRKVPDTEHPKRKRLVAHEDEAIWVQEIFERRVSGFGATQIADALNSQGAMRRDGSRWGKSSVLYVLKNPMMIGRTTYGRRARSGRVKDPSTWIVVDAHQPLVSMDLWNRAQALMGEATPAATSEGGSPNSTHMFTGLMRCGVCGQAMQIETARGRTRRYAYYVCQRSIKHGDCKARRIRSDYVDPWLSGVIADQVITPANMRDLAIAIEAECSQYLAQRGKRRYDLERRKTALKAANGKLLDVLEQMGRDAPNLADIGPRIRENNAAIKALDASIAELETAAETAFKFDARAIDELTVFMRSEITKTENARSSRALFSRFIKSVTVHGDSIDISYDPARLLLQPEPVHSEVIWLPEHALLRTAVYTTRLPRWSWIRRAA